MLLCMYLCYVCLCMLGMYVCYVCWCLNCILGNYHSYASPKSLKMKVFPPNTWLTSLYNRLAYKAPYSPACSHRITMARIPRTSVGPLELTVHLQRVGALGELQLYVASEPRPAFGWPGEYDGLRSLPPPLRGGPKTLNASVGGSKE